MTAVLRTPRLTLREVTNDGGPGPDETLPLHAQCGTGLSARLEELFE